MPGFFEKVLKILVEEIPMWAESLIFVGGGASARDTGGDAGFGTLAQLQSITAISAARPRVPLRSIKHPLLFMQVPQPDRVVIESPWTVVRQS